MANDPRDDVRHDNSTTADAEKPWAKGKKLAILVPAIHFLVICMWLKVDLDSEPEGSKWWLASLLALLILIPLIALVGKDAEHRFRWKALIYTGRAIIGIDVMLALYCVSTPDMFKTYHVTEIIAYFSISSAMLLVYVTLKGPDELFRERERCPSALPSAIIAFALFMCVSFYVGFALAFFDRSAKEAGEERVFYSPKRIYFTRSQVESGAQRLRQDGIGCYCSFVDCEKWQSQGNKNGFQAAPEQVAVFWMRDSDTQSIFRADLLSDFTDTVEAKLEIGSRDPLADAQAFMAGGAEKITTSICNLAEGGNGKIEGEMLGVINACALGYLLDGISRLEDSAVIQIRVEANITSSSLGDFSIFRSHAELAATRARNIVETINDGLLGLVETKAISGFPAIEYITQFNDKSRSGVTLCDVFKGAGGCGAFSRGCEKGRERPLFSLLAPVKVSIRRFSGKIPEMDGNADLSLLDYMYFSIYTITTTGYGDIIPVKPVSRVVVSVANLFEVFFVVIFVNILIDRRRISG
ncbi:MAG: two pore domain potassium channel family protein [Thermoanaerobaculia bacterium]|nr:two pore domain potassium channel family protein [Thermoanaerobaculia bacterium]